MASAHYDLTADAGDLVSEMNRASAALYKVDRAGDKAAKATKRVGGESKKTKTLLEAFKNAAEGLGGKTGESAGKIEKFGKAFSGLSTVAGPATLAVGGAASAVLAFGLAGAAAAIKTSALVKAMKAAGRSVPISKDQIRQVEDMDAELKGLREDVERLVVLLGTEFAPALGKVFRAMRGGLDVVESLAGYMQDFSRGAQAFVSLGASEYFDLWDDTAAKASESTRKLTEEYERLRASSAIFDNAAGPLDLAPVRAVETAHQRAQAARSAREKELAAAEALAAKALAAKAEADGLYADLGNQDALMEERRIAAVQDRMAAEQSLAAMLHGQHEQERQAFEQELQQAQQLKDARINAQLTSASTIAASASQLATHFAQVDEDATESAKRRALAAFRISQGAAVAQIAISTAQGIMQGIGQLGPVAGGFAAIGTAATGATQAALVLAQPPPQFDQGGVMAPDHMSASVAPGEGLLTRAGVANVGGEDGLRAMNQGRGGVRSRQVVTFRNSHRYYDAVLEEHLDRGGPVQQQITGATGAIGHTVVGG